MKAERLKVAVEQLTAILQDMQSEVNEYDCQMSEWYWEQLTQHHSGLSTNEEFHNETVLPYRDLYRDFSMSDVIRRLESLEKTVVFFNENSEKLKKNIREAKNRVPAGWKRWEVTYKDSQCAVDQHSDFYAPTPEAAGEMCKKVYTFEHNTIDIVEVKEEKV